MKFGPQSLRFMRASTLFRKNLAFVGRQNTIHLQETALVIEGHLLRFRLPIVDQFVQRAFCEWSTVTVPYARIVRHTYHRPLIVKVLWWFFIGPVAALVGFATLGLERDWFAAGMSALLLCLASWLSLMVFRSRHFLVFRRADGRRCLVCFRFTAREQRQKFVSLLEANRRAARALTAPAARSSGKRVSGPASPGGV
jgi:hypothetical protein